MPHEVGQHKLWTVSPVDSIAWSMSVDPASQRQEIIKQSLCTASSSGTFTTMYSIWSRSIAYFSRALPEDGKSRSPYLSVKITNDDTVHLVRVEYGSCL